MVGCFTFGPSSFCLVKPSFFSFSVIGVIGFVLNFLWVGLDRHLLGWAGLVFVMAVLFFFFFFEILMLCFYIFILFIGNIMNKSLFMQVEIAKNLLLFGETTTILFI